MKTRVETFADGFAEAVRQAFAVTYGVPSRDQQWASVRPTWSDEGVAQGWHDPDPSVVLVGTEYAWINDPWTSDKDQRLWNKTMEILRGFGYGDVHWDSLNSAVHVVYLDMPEKWHKILIERAVKKGSRI